MKAFFCEICNQSFVSNAPSFVAEAECERTFGGLHDEDATVCEECYERFMDWFNTTKEAA